MTSLTEILVDLPSPTSILLKITIVLGASWIVHFVLAGRNPRWRVLLWRCAIAGVLLVPVLVPFGYLQVSVTPPAEPAAIAQSESAIEYPVTETPRVAGAESVVVSGPEVLNISQPSFSLSEWLGENIWMIVLFGWGIVTTISILRVLAGFVRVKRKIISSVAGPKHLQQVLDRVAGDLGCTAKVELRCSVEMSTPFLTGLRRPIVIVPKRMIDGKYESKWEAIFAHEIAHLKSRDLIWTLVIRCFEVVMWFHPFIWKLRSAHSAACEEVSDAVAADYIGNTESYSSTLADIALEIIGRVPVIGGIPMARSSEIVARLRMLKKRIYQARLARRWIMLSGLASFIVIATIGGLNLVYAEDSELSRSEKRVLHFPKDRSLGTIKIRDLNDKPSRHFDWEFLNQWDVFAQAKGDVIVPKDKKLALIINKEAAKDLSPLSLLEPDIFHVLSLSNSGANDETLQHIVNLNGLEQLNLVGTKITDDGMKQLAKLKPLKRLHLGNTTIGDDGIANISEMSLEFINLMRTPITDQALRHLSKITTLKGIGFMFNDIGDTGLAYLKDLNHLKGLSLYQTKITDKGLANLEKLTDLEYLALNGTDVSDVGIKHLSNLQTLKTLDLYGTNVSDKGLELLTSLSSLEEVMLPSITDKSMASISKIGSLKRLDLTGEFTDQGLAHLLKLKNLERLRISARGRGITDDGMQHIAKITSLKLLWIQHTSISDNGLEKLKSLDKLEELLFNGSRPYGVTSDGLRHLQQFPNLKQLYLSKIKQNQAGLKHLGALTKLEGLDIDPVQTDDNTLKVDETELRHLSKLNNLKKLRLGNIQITDNGMKYLSDLTSLEELNISALGPPQITDEGLKYLVDNKKLKRLSITASITDDGLKSLAELKSLETVRLYGATVTQESLDQFYAQLPCLQTVEFRTVGLQPTVSSGKKPKVGQLAPDFELTSLIGRDLPGLERFGVESSTEMAKDKRLLICFFDMNQRPSRHMVAEIARRAPELRERGIVVVCVQTSKVDKKQLREWAKENAVPLPIGMVESDEKNVRSNWGVKSLPWLILTDKQHIVRAEGFGIEELDEKVKPEEGTEDLKILKRLAELSEANRSLLRQGRIHATRSRGNLVFDVQCIYKDNNIRINWTRQQDGKKNGREVAVVTDEEFRWYFVGDIATISDPKYASSVIKNYRFLPSKHWSNGTILKRVISGKEVVSRKVMRERINGSDMFVLEVIWEKRPKDICRYYFDPAKAGAITKHEVYHDYGTGHLLNEQADMEMQLTKEGAWYLKHSRHMVYRNGKPHSKEEIKIKSCDFTFPVLDEEFTWKAMGLTPGTRIQDKRLGISYKYGSVLDPEQPKPQSIPKETIEHQIPEKAKLFLESINQGKESREYWRRLYAMVNKAAPKLDVDHWMNSKLLRLSDLRGKVVVLEFWGIDCGPCLGEIKNINEMHKRAKSEPVVVIAVHYAIDDDDIDEVKSVVTKQKIKYPVCIDRQGGAEKYFGGRTFEKYNTKGIPNSFLIDIEGRVRRVGSPVVKQMLDELIKEAAVGRAGTSKVDTDRWSGVKVAPKTVSFGILSPGQKAQKSVYIYKADDPAFEVKIESGPDQSVTTELLRYEEQDALLYELRILLQAGVQSVSYASSVKLSTNDAQMRDIVIPVTAAFASE